MLFFLAGFCLGMDRHLYHFVYSYFKSATGAIQVKKKKTKYWAAILNSDDIFVVVLFFLSSFSFFAFFLGMYSRNCTKKIFLLWFLIVIIKY